jgi:outer membrane autotransporter protein
MNATALSLGNIQLSNLEERLDNIRAGSTGFSSAGFNINGGTASLGGGYAGPTGPEYGYIDLNGFAETGSLAPLKFPDQNTESERTAFGGKVSYQCKIGNVTVIPDVNAAWQHEFGTTAYSVVANFANGAGKSFSVSGPDIGRDSLLVGAGASVIWNDRVSTYIYYDGEFARTNYYSNNVTGGVRITF